ncbi:MAG: YggT family protein [Coriobacteriales bacterium]|jgi:uncharacterized protein YggT (Ycf19 family)|nr:YggT family protein [Coriobacteriales bacterium]
MILETLGNAAANQLAVSLLPFALKQVILVVFNFYVILIIVWALFSWFDHSKGILNDIYNIIDAVVSPYVGLFKRFIPSMGGFDISPMIAIVVLYVVQRLLLGL